MTSVIDGRWADIDGKCYDIDGTRNNIIDGRWEHGTICYRNDKGVLSSSEIMSKGGKELVDIY